MKDSSIEWVGEIPAHWEIQKLKYQAEKFERGTSLDYTDEPITKVVNQATFSKGFFDKKNIRFSKKDSAISRGLLKKGDVLLASTGGGVLGKTHFFSEDDVYVADSHITIVRTIDTLFSKYLYYYFFVNYSTFNAVMAEGSTNQTELQRDLLGKMPVPFPPIEEQQKIASFLDEKCTEIDSLISELKKQTETLEKYKRSVITEAVTKGLNSNIKMKDSGVQWIGKIPEHWNTHPIYCYFSERKNKNSLGLETNLLSLSYGKIVRRNINSNDGLLPESFNTYNIIEKDDIIIRPTDLQNDKKSLRTGISKEHGIITSAYIAMKAIKPVNPKYFHYLLHTYDVMKVFYNMGNGVRQGLNFSEFSRLIVFEPTIEEQNEIVAFLQEKCTEIDKIISEKKQQIKTIEEYKKSLIFEYVIGKKEV